MGSNKADKPLRRIGALFEQLAAVAKQQQQTAMAAGDFSRACSNVSVLFGCLGIAFKFAEMDYVAKASAPSPSPLPALARVSRFLPRLLLRASRLFGMLLRCACMW